MFWRSSISTLLRSRYNAAIASRLPYKSFAKKGDAIVEMNYKAIDAGFDAFVKIDVPASWADAQDTEGDHCLLYTSRCV